MPLEAAPSRFPLSANMLFILGISGIETLLVPLATRREGVFTALRAFLGLMRCSLMLTFSPLLPPPAPEGKSVGGLPAFTARLMTHVSAMTIKATWKTTEMIKPSPPNFRQKRCQRVGGALSVQSGRQGSPS